MQVQLISKTYFDYVGVFYCYLTSYHRLSSSTFSLSSYLLSLTWSHWVLCSLYHKAGSKVSAMVNYSLEGLGKYLLLVHWGCWQNLATWSCRTEVPISLKAVSQGSLFIPRNYSLFLAHGSFHPLSKQQQTHYILLLLENSVTSLSAISLRKFSAFKGFSWVRSTQITSVY